jgi:nucleotide-binding universal stress UspA family protein
VQDLEYTFSSLWAKNPNLIVMSTDGRNGFLDALRGSHSERVLRRIPCPLLAIPAEAAVAQGLSASQE